MYRVKFCMIERESRFMFIFSPFVVNENDV